MPWKKCKTVHKKRVDICVSPRMGCLLELVPETANEFGEMVSALNLDLPGIEAALPGSEEPPPPRPSQNSPNIHLPPNPDPPTIHQMHLPEFTKFTCPEPRPSQNSPNSRGPGPRPSQNSPNWFRAQTSQNSPNSGPRIHQIHLPPNPNPPEFTKFTCPRGPRNSLGGRGRCTFRVRRFGPGNVRFRPAGGLHFGKKNGRFGTGLGPPFRVRVCES